MTNPNYAGRQKIGAATGIAAPIVAFTCIFGAIASYPQFSWTNNALSDLGVVPGVTAPLFNFGLIAAGVLAFCFSVFGLFVYLGKSRVGRVGGAFFAVSNIALVCIGIFNESFKPTHYWFSVAFFVLAPIALFILTCVFYLDRQVGAAIFTAVIGVVAAVPWILLFTIHYVSNVAIPETISGAAIAVWTIMVVTKMLRANPNPMRSSIS